MEIGAWQAEDFVKYWLELVCVVVRWIEIMQRLLELEKSIVIFFFIFNLFLLYVLFIYINL